MSDNEELVRALRESYEKLCGSGVIDEDLHGILETDLDLILDRLQNGATRPYSEVREDVMKHWTDEQHALHRQALAYYEMGADQEDSPPSAAARLARRRPAEEAPEG